MRTRKFRFLVHAKSWLVEGGTSLSTVSRIALVGCGYWGKNLCRNFHALGALAAVVDATDKGKVTARSIAPGVNITGIFDDIYMMIRLRA